METVVSVLKDILLFLFWTIFVYCIGVFSGSSYQLKEDKRAVKNAIEKEKKNERTKEQHKSNE